MSKQAFYPADILLPKDCDMSKWAVIACDQFTSQPEYWAKVEENVGESISTLKLILPEAKLNQEGVEKEIEKINHTMQEYLDKGVFKTYNDSLIYIERSQSDGRTRHGLIGMVDLEQYDFLPGSDALIRATEGTVLERIPPRVKVRENAPIELPHIMLLIDDEKRTVIEPLKGNVETKLYDFSLQEGGGHIAGYLLSEKQKTNVLNALNDLASKEVMKEKYGLDTSPLLFAVGDGNHSLATAKQCYENLKKVTPESEWANLKARYALVEVVNNHDDALQFEPIHRVLFNVDPLDFMAYFKKHYPEAYEGEGEGQHIEVVYENYDQIITIPNPKYQLAVGSLQAVIDEYLKEKESEVDYIHGDDVTKDLGSKKGNMAFLLPAMGKQELFKTVMADGVLPRKTFSMGHAQDKRYYIEAREIR